MIKKRENENMKRVQEHRCKLQENRIEKKEVKNHQGNILIVMKMKIRKK